MHSVKISGFRVQDRRYQKVLCHDKFLAFKKKIKKVGWEAKVGRSLSSRRSLVYKWSSKTAWATKRNPVSKPPPPPLKKPYINACIHPKAKVGLGRDGSVFRAHTGGKNSAPGPMSRQLT